MGFQLEDGRGSGRKQEVNKNHAAVVAAITQTEFEKASELGDAYSWMNVSYDYDAGDTILGIRNISPTRKLHIARIYMSAKAATVVQLHIVDGSAALAGTAVTGVNLNRTSGSVAEVDAKGDETTNSSQGTLFLSPELEAAKMVELDLQGAIILGTNDMLGVDFVTAGGTDTALVTIFGYYENT